MLLTPFLVVRRILVKHSVLEIAVNFHSAFERLNVAALGGFTQFALAVTVAVFQFAGGIFPSQTLVSCSKKSKKGGK